MFKGLNSGEIITRDDESGFEIYLTEKQKFYLYLFMVCPSLDIIHLLWNTYVKNRDDEIKAFHDKVSTHPCGNDSLFYNIVGSIDPDIFMEYYIPREPFLLSIKLIGHPDFLCKFGKSKSELESSIYYFDRVLNEPQIKLKAMDKKNVLDLVINKLLYDVHLYPQNIISYLTTIFNTYKNIKILHAYPIAIDIDGQLCRFE